MVNKKLADWIKSEEAQGYSEQQLRQYLLQQGYNKKNVEDTIKSFSNVTTKFSITGYIKSISIPVFLLFLISFFFLSFSFDKLIEGIFFLATLVVLAFIIDLLYKKNKFKFTKYFIGLSFIILVILSFNYQLFYVTTLSLIALIHMLKYYIGSNKRYNLESIFLTLLISLTFASAIAFIFYLTIAYGVDSFLNTIKAVISFLIVTPIILVFTYSYLSISIALLKKSLGEFNYEAYFKHKFLPFSIFNWMYTKDKNLRSSIIKTTLLIYFLFLVVFLITTAFIGLNFVNNNHSEVSDRIYVIRDIVIPPYSYERHVKIIKLKGFEIIRINQVIEDKGNFLYIKQDLENIETTYYDCDINLNCKNKPYNLNQKLEKQVSLKGISFLVVAKINSKKVIFLLPKESSEEIITHHIFEFEDPEFKNTKIISEINEKMQIIKRDILNKNIEKPRNWQKLSFFYTGKAYDDVADGILIITRFGLSLSDVRQSISIASKEYARIKGNRINSTLFYEGSTNIDQHIQHLQNNIDNLYQKLTNKPKEAKRQTTELADFDFFDEKGSLFDLANAKIVIHLDIFKAIVKLGEGLVEERTTRLEERIYKEYSKKDIEESETSKAIRLKILETKIASRVIANCETEECKTQIISLTKNPEFCTRLDYKERDRCIILYSIYDKEYCEKISDEALKQECLSK